MPIQSNKVSCTNQKGLIQDKEKKVDVSFEVDKKTGVMRMKVDAPNKKMEKEVAENFLELIKTCGEITGEKVKVLKKGYSK